MGTRSEGGREKKRGMNLALECRQRVRRMLDEAKWFGVTGRKGSGSGDGWEREEDEETRVLQTRGARQHCSYRQLRCLLSAIR